nr:hypothetical protein [Streptomyces fradiae]
MRRQRCTAPADAHSPSSTTTTSRPDTPGRGTDTGSATSGDRRTADTRNAAVPASARAELPYCA